MQHVTLSVRSILHPSLDKLLLFFILFLCCMFLFLPFITMARSSKGTCTGESPCIFSMLAIAPIPITGIQYVTYLVYPKSLDLQPDEVVSYAVSFPDTALLISDWFYLVIIGVSGIGSYVIAAVIISFFDSRRKKSTY